MRVKDKGVEIDFDRDQGKVTLVWGPRGEVQDTFSLVEFKELCRVFKEELNRASLDRLIRSNQFLRKQQREEGKAILFFFDGIFIKKNKVHLLCSFLEKKLLSLPQRQVIAKTNIGPLIFITHHYDDRHSHARVVPDARIRRPLRDAAFALPGDRRPALL